MLSSWKICCACIPQRWILAVMTCFAIMNGYTMRICLSIAITEMVTATNQSSSHTSSDEVCPATELSTSSTGSSGGAHEWTEYTQGIILSSFYWGHVISQLPCGMLADKFGGKHVLGFGILSTAIFTLLTPVVVEAFDAPGLVVLRFLIGMGEGMVLPAVNVLLAHWAPPEERSMMGALAMAGMKVGTMLGNGLSGVFIQNSSIGWPIVFYVFGSVSVVWFLAWIFLCYNNPDDHPFISDEERKRLGETMREHMHKDVGPIPWRHIVTSVPLWALLVAKAGWMWGYYTMLTDLPKYMSSVLKFSVQSNGLLSALPYLVLFLVSISSSWLADWLIKTERLSRTNVRKIFASFALATSAVCIIAASYAGCDRIVVTILFTIGVGMMGPIFCSVMVNALDLSPNYSGTLMGITNGVAAIVGVVAPYAVGILTPNQTFSEWRIVFWITFIANFVAVFIYDLWASGEVQYWNDPDFRKRQQTATQVQRVSTDTI
ncbi:putative inorganic phosphate cotransporter [Neodiprion fabricii]|uniref:putative inorganic phosphate cotransporter n=1 Tax=Neodiprion fabricii TaxID=2872261 RepID=UPI001ED90231|nr:putative inorganic phosphate cotransporter [Neodiprion fabricii]